VERDKLDLKVM